MTDAQWTTLRRLDEACGAPKGTAFRAFKRLTPHLVEGRDYRVLERSRDAAQIETLRGAGAIYASTLNVVLLAPAAATTIRAAMAR
jgi:hypothetical protein